MVLALLEKLGLKEKIYADDKYPPQRNSEHYRTFNKGRCGVIYHDAPVFEMASAGGPDGWGNHIAWQTYPSERDNVHGTIVGFCRRFPKVGELVVSVGSSGLYHYMAVTKVNPCGDPSDMFFAEVRAVASFAKKLTYTKPMN